jgi:hypothetical protein
MLNQMYPAESATVTYDLGRKLALVDLYRALGGRMESERFSVDQQHQCSTPGVNPTSTPCAARCSDHLSQSSALNYTCGLQNTPLPWRNSIAGLHRASFQSP